MAFEKLRKKRAAEMEKHFMKYDFELLIDDELYRLFDDFRAFRHKFRHMYSFELDWERECIVARKFPVTVKKFKKQVRGFVKKLEQADKSEKP